MHLTSEPTRSHDRLVCSMDVGDWAALVTAAATVALVVAVVAWWTARATLAASRRASEAAEAANEQARLDSIAQTRPYVYVEVVPGLAGMDTYDVRVFNSGRSAARGLTLDYDSWPAQPDSIVQALEKMFHTPRILPPGCSLRAVWRLGGGQGGDRRRGRVGHHGEDRVE